MLIGISDQMGTRFDRLRYEVFQNLILSPMNTGLLRPAVATVLTVYGIETSKICFATRGSVISLQQFLPFTVLKQHNLHVEDGCPSIVATVLTVYGIETAELIVKERWAIIGCNSSYRLRYAPKGARRQRSKATMKSAHLKYLSEAKVKQR